VNSKSRGGSNEFIFYYCFQGTALFLAAAKGYSEILHLLIQSGAKINLRNFAGSNLNFYSFFNIKDTALIVAVKYGQIESIRFLIQSGKEVVIGETGWHLFMMLYL